MKISGRKGSGYIAHNNREFTCRNVDPNRSKNNIFIKKETLEEAYNKIFGDSFKEYNNSIRKDRRFDGSYLQKLRNSKNKHKQKIATQSLFFDANLGPNWMFLNNDRNNVDNPKDCPS